MKIEDLDDIDLAAVARVGQTLGTGFIDYARVVLPALVVDPAIGHRELALGICQAHVDGLGAALHPFSPALQSKLIVGMADKLFTIGKDGQ